MAKLSISEAIRRSGVSRATFYSKYINTNLISVEKNNRGKKQIDTSELLRVFGELSDTPTEQTPKPVQNTPENSSDSLQIQVVRLEVENKMLREKIDDQDRHYGKQIALLEHIKDTYKPWWKFWEK